MIHINLSQLQMSCAGETYPALEQIPAMQRRRLSSIAKLALSCAIETLAQNKVDYIVWASQYGDESKTYKILEDVLQGLTPSPTQFSTSVHNAIAGLYSILCQDKTPSTSLCANWSEALFEAYAYLKTSEYPARVLVVYYDAPLPTVYVEYKEFQFFAMAALVELQHPNLTVTLSNIQNHTYKYVDALKFHQFWTEGSDSKMRVWR
ncbi:beta-ketoacyl synthase chain length factor [Acinetobacter silvestris]|uniref:Beta-ketoacyl synthase n=1 Tax=Acinetobacter silvestris TaxID=1977882 RepID=A0A1Y3CLB3_9GAMM|nr:beta-ketoacyl synthase chain length factor [Acinetobacter silvestris]OTG67382.1 beta-ketoacyl synthase [Acinetobacter silvestris]